MAVDPPRRRSAKPVVDRVRHALNVIEGVEGCDFAVSDKYGYVTSSPTNLGSCKLRPSLPLLSRIIVYVTFKIKQLGEEK